MTYERGHSQRTDFHNVDRLNPPAPHASVSSAHGPGITRSRNTIFFGAFRSAVARDAGLRIHHFLLSPSLRNDYKPAASTSSRAGEHTSDHAPVSIQLDND